jgi:hypothetical protein
MTNWIKRLQVKINQKKDLNAEKTAFKNLTTDEVLLAKRFIEAAEKYRDSIYFDPLIKETLIDARTENSTYIIKGNHFSIENHSGFLEDDLPDDTVEWILLLIRRRAHQYRRKLKYQARQNRLAFLKSRV